MANKVPVKAVFSGAVVTALAEFAATDTISSTLISNTPAGNIAATTVQAAINELDTEKAAINNVAPDIHAATSKATPVDADELGLADSAASFGLKKLTWANLKALLFHKANILGTVSQSAGVPTGAIIERGSNANGEYVKFADGTLICTRLFATFAAVGTGSTLISWVFPASFIAVPVCPAWSGSPSLSASVVGFNYHQGISTSGCTQAFTNNAAAQDVTNTSFFATGRWF